MKNASPIGRLEAAIRTRPLLVLLSAILLLIPALSPAVGGEAPDAQAHDLSIKATEHYNALRAWFERLSQKRPGKGARAEEIEAFNKEYSQYAASLAEYKKEAASLSNLPPAPPTSAVKGAAPGKGAETSGRDIERRENSPPVTFETPPYGKAGEIGVHILRVKGKIIRLAHGAESADLPRDCDNVVLLASGWENEPVQRSAAPPDAAHGQTHTIVKVPLMIFCSAGYSEGDTFEDIVYPAGATPFTDPSGARVMLPCYGTSPEFVQKLRTKNNRNPRGKCFGTGFFITAKGHLVTNWHVVNGGKHFQVQTQGHSYEGTLLFADKANDIAVLKIEAASNPLPISSSREVALGDDVFTIGFPVIELQGVQPKLTSGKISSLAGIKDDPRYFQISVPVQPGNSGGGLVNSKGNIVGIVTASLNASFAYRATGALPQNVNYALKSSLLLTLLENAPEIGPLLSKPKADPPGQPGESFRAAEAAAVLIKAD